MHSDVHNGINYNRQLSLQCRALLEMAQDSPLNDTQEGPAWAEVLQPQLTSRAKM